MTNNKDKFCPLPWVHLAIRNNGDLRVCCHTNNSEDKGTLRDQQGKAYNISQIADPKIRNASLLKEIRQSMIKGKDHPACIRCLTEESNSLRSRRQYEREHWKESFNFDQAQEATAADGSINPRQVPILTCDIRFGNRCNLKCRMCGPTDSDYWYNDYYQVWNEDSFYDGHGKVQMAQDEKGHWKPLHNDYGWIDQNHVWREIENHFDDILYIYTVGGEPLIIEKHYQLLERCIEKGRASQITLEYNTNLTVLPSRALSLWKHFKKVRFGISVDGYDKANDYIRSPSKWQNIEANIKKLHQVKGPFEVWLSSTVQAYNAFNILELIRWRLQSTILQTTRARHHPLHNPPYLSLKVFPKPIKEEITRHYRRFFDWLDEWYNSSPLDQKIKKLRRQETKAMLESYINYMNSEDLSAHFPLFLDYTKKMDLIRKENFAQALPLLHQKLAPHLETSNAPENWHA